MAEPAVDAIFFGAHPDDVEILGGGIVARMARAGNRVAIVDATRGEMGTRGTVEQRAQEAADAARVFGVERHNLGLPDGRIADDIPAATRAAVRVIRDLRPRLVFVHESGDHHPDHNALSQAVKFACFQANVLRYDTGQGRHKVRRLFFYVGSRERWPDEASLIVDVTDVWDLKIEALRTHRSQFYNPDDPAGPETFISSEHAWKMIETRASFFGSLIGVRYGEPLRANSPLRIDDLLSLPDA